MKYVGAGGLFIHPRKSGSNPTWERVRFGTKQGKRRQNTLFCFDPAPKTFDTLDDSGTAAAGSRCVQGCVCKSAEESTY